MTMKSSKHRLSRVIMKGRDIDQYHVMVLTGAALIVLILLSTMCFAQELGKKTFPIGRGYITEDCSLGEVRLINNAQGILLTALTTGFTNFQTCLDNAPLVEFACNRWPVSRHAAETLREPHITKIQCYDAPRGVAAQAPVDITGESLKINHNFLASNSDRSVAAVIAHEIMHNRGYRHSQYDFGNAYYPNTVPQQVRACIQNVAPNPSGGPTALGFCTHFDRGDSLAAGDLDGDGRVEILVSEDDGGKVDAF